MHVAAPHLADHFALAMLGARFVHHGLVQVRIEVGAQRFDRRARRCLRSRSCSFA